MPDHDLQKPLQPFPAVLNHIVAKPVRENLPRQGWDCDSGGLPFEHVAEVFEVGVAAAYDRVSEFESWDVGAGVDLVGCVHAARGGAVGLGVLHLWGWVSLVEGGERCRMVLRGSVDAWGTGRRGAYFDLEEVFRWSIDLFKGL